MTGFNHGLTGALIALATKNPYIAIPASFASHFACDAIPHFGVKEGTLFGRTFNIILITDFIFAVILMIILGRIFPDQRILIWVCMVAAASPDLMWAYYQLYLSRIKHRAHIKLDPLARFHKKIQWSETLKGASVELLWFSGCVVILLDLAIKMNAPQ